METCATAAGGEKTIDPREMLSEMDVLKQTGMLKKALE